jgi:Protein of unknown function (DUF3244).
MKRFIYFIIFFCFASIGIVLAGNTSVVLNPTLPPAPSPRAPSVNRTTVTATCDGTDLAISFSAPVGIATITLTDEMGEIWCQETIDTNIVSSFDIQVGGFDSGHYTVAVDHGSTKLSGSIEL